MQARDSETEDRPRSEASVKQRRLWVTGKR